jgi:hypothetical protein
MAVFPLKYSLEGILKNSKALNSFLVLAALMLTCSPAYAARKLTKNKNVSIRSKHCTLTLGAQSDSELTISCVGEKTKKRTPKTTDKIVWLKPSKSITVKGKNCFPVIQSVTENKITIKCLLTAPTATPTAATTPTATATSTNTPAVTPDTTLLLNANQIVQFAKNTPAFPKTAQDLTGVTTGDIIVSIDRRPQNNRLYGLGYNGTSGTVRLYQISEETGTAGALPDPTTSFVDEDGNPVRIGLNADTKIEIDFNPLVDRLRVVTSNGQNFRMNPNTGDFIDGNLGGGALTGINMDGITHGSTSTLTGAAYTNNQTNVTATTLYTHDNTTKGVFIQSPPNEGTQTGSNILTTAPFNIAGFDIGADALVTTSNNAVTSGTGNLFAQLEFGGPQLFCSFNLVTAAMGTCNAVGSNTSGVLGLALNDFSGLSIIGLSSAGNLVRFKSSTPGTTTTVATSGITAGESLVGIDFRPSTGQLFSVGINATANIGTVYILDPQTGVATVVGSTGSISGVDFPDPASSTYAINFNPTADRIRLITSTGINMRLSPLNGIVSSNDVAINGLGAVVNGASYTDSYGGATLTTLYTIDALNKAIYIQNPANNGTQTNKINLVFSPDITFNAELGFEIQSGARVSANGAALTSDFPHTAYATLTSGGVPKLYLIDLTTGQATVVGTLGTSLRSLAVATDNVNR